MIVENKVGSGEHSNQLNRYIKAVDQRYPSWKKLGIFLTPEGEQSTHPKYVPVSYGAVREAVVELLERRGASIGEEIRLPLEHYVQLLERHVVTESEIAELCRQIYRKHRRALDLIFEHRPDATAAMSDFLQSIIAESDAVIDDVSSKSYVRFCHPDWDVPVLSTGRWTKTGRVLLFEFVMDYRGLFLHLQIGPGPLETRRALFEAALKSEVLKPSSRKLHKDWNDIWPNRKIIKADELEELPLEELEERVNKFWKLFVLDDLPAIADDLRPAVEELKATDAVAPKP